MIGQEKNKQQLLAWRMNKSVPRFIVMEGEIGSGRLTFAKAIIKQINATGIISGNTIAEVREVIENAYTITSTTCYIFRDCDEMSVAAKNALLKVVEEPPKNVYFIMTIKSTTNMLATILSRATVIKMQPYKLNELEQASNNKIILKYATTIGQAKEFEEARLLEAEKLCAEIYNSIRATKGTAILKSCTNLQAKNSETDKLSCSLFMKVFEMNFPSDIFTMQTLSSISQCKKEMKRGVVNQKASIECMLLRIIEERKNAEVSKTMG